MSFIDKLLGRRGGAATAEDDSWMSDEQRAAKLAWWESRWMDRLVGALATLLRSLAVAATLLLLAALGWKLYQTTVPPPDGPVTADVTRAASFTMIVIVLGVPLALAAGYFLLRTLFNILAASLRSTMHKTFHPLVAPTLSVVFLALLALLHEPAYQLVERAWFTVAQTHLLAKTKFFGG